MPAVKGEYSFIHPLYYLLCRAFDMIDELMEEMESSLPIHRASHVGVRVIASKKKKGLVLCHNSRNISLFQKNETN